MKDNLSKLCRSLLILCCVLAIAGCNTIQESKEAQQMDARLTLYGKTVRWGALQNLYGFLTPEESVKVVFPGNLENIRVTDYQVRIPPMMLDQHTLAQTATIEYLFRDTQVIRTLSDYQIWKYDEEINDWFRANPIPVFE